MKKIFLLVLAMFGIGGASAASANTVIVEHLATYNAQLKGGNSVAHRGGHHHGGHRHGHRYHGHHRYHNGGYYYNGYYYYPRHRYYDYYYYY